MGSLERPETEDARPIPPSIRMCHLGESRTGRSGCNQPTAETAIEVREGRGPRPTSANLSGLKFEVACQFPRSPFLDSFRFADHTGVAARRSTLESRARPQ